MKKQEIAAFFDSAAPSWDAEMIRSDEVIGAILDDAGVAAGKDILDVACGTGVLIPDYLARGVESVTGVDISREMVRIAREKFAQNPRVTILCADAEAMDALRQYDCIVIYNAFPHFPDPQRLLRSLIPLLREDGTLTVAHGMSRAQIDRHHEHGASRVSRGLMHEKVLAALFELHGLRVTACVSDARRYQVSGRKE